MSFDFETEKKTTTRKRKSRLRRPSPRTARARRPSPSRPVAQKAQVSILDSPKVPPELPSPSRIDPNFEQLKIALEAQRRELGRMIADAMVALRAACWSGDAEEGAAIADAFHNVPGMMFAETFEWNWFRGELERYADRYPERGRAWLERLDAIERSP